MHSVFLMLLFTLTMLRPFFVFFIVRLSKGPESERQLFDSHLQAIYLFMMT